MSRRKRTTKFLIGLIAIIFLSASIAPYLLYRNQERIVLAAVEELNKRQNGHLIYKKSKISPLKQFPYISIEIDSIYFFQDKSNSLDTTSLPIYSIEELYLGFDAWKILGGEFDIKELTIHGGNLNLLTDEDGRINLLLAKSSNQEIERQAGASDNISLNIEKLHLRNFFIDKTNEKLQQHYQFHVKKADLSFNYGQDSIDIALKASMQVGDFEVEKFHFLQNKQLDVQVQGGYGQKSGFITLDPSSIELEGVELNLDGSVATKDSIRLDLALNGQKKNFDILLNFAPNNIQKQAKAFQNEGDIFFIGKIKGPIQYGLPSVDI
ncbi:MAG TPA: hypothetical protein VJ917_12720, partial [Saprospiraceae bacterium]|nr:hypothetical protein [Saprospiraceae bacterium]